MKKQWLLTTAMIATALLAACGDEEKEKAEDKVNTTQTTEEKNEGSKEEVTKEEPSKETTKETETTTTKEDHHHENTVHIDFEQSEATLNEKTKLSVALQKDEAPFTEGRVRYEIALNGGTNEDKAWITLQEDQKGHYEGTYTFKKAGDYTLTLHIEKAEPQLHEHQDTSFVVK